MFIVVLSVLLSGAQAEFTTGPIQCIAEGFKFTEGPLWLPSNVLIFSDIPADTIYRADKSIFRTPSGCSNGLTLDPQGRLIAAEHKNRRVSRTEADGTVVTVADRFEGKRLNSPNDVVVRSDGTIFFTDPPYGLEGGLTGPNAELDFAGIFCITPKGEVHCLARDFKKPNGITLSPDEKILYVADCEGNRIKAFDLNSDGISKNTRVLCEIPHPDGMKADEQGNLWSTAKEGIRVISPKGELLQTIAFSQQTTNCAFGGPDGAALYVTTPNAVYRVPTRVHGATWAMKK